MRGFAIAFLLAIGLREAIPQNLAAEQPYTMAQVWTLDANYHDTQHGVTFRYPSVWKPETEFGYNPGALSVAKPIAGFGFEEGGFPRDAAIGPYTNSNVEGFGVVYAAVKASSAAACEERASSVAGDRAGSAKHAVFGKRSFSDREIGEAGMSQGTTGELYSTWARGTCYMFEIDLAMALGMLEDEEPLTPVQKRAIWRHLTAIMKTVRIAEADRTR